MTSSMKKRTALTATVLTMAGMSACGGNGQDTAQLPGQPTPTAPQPQSLDTAQVLALAQKPSETATPLPVDAGLLVLNDTSETSEPITVNAQ
jgi:hypothetical protein